MSFAAERFGSKYGPERGKAAPVAESQEVPCTYQLANHVTFANVESAKG
jgi:hypothetical protein